MKQKWFIATLLITCVVDARAEYTSLCDEQVRSIRASTVNEAYTKAIELGKAEEHTYENMYGELVRWEFVGLMNLEELSSNTIRDGTEIRSRLFKSRNPAKHVTGKTQLAVYLAQPDG